MTAYTIYGEHGGGYLWGDRHSSADGTPTGNYAGAADVAIGISEPGATAYEGFLTFNTSAVVGTVTAVTLSLWGNYALVPINFDIEVRAHDWGATLEAADWLGRDSLTAQTLVASRNTVGWSTSGYNVFTTETDFPGAGGWGVGQIRMGSSASGIASVINQGGETRFVVCSSIHRVGGASEFSAITFVGAAEGFAPKLEITT